MCLNRLHKSFLCEQVSENIFRDCLWTLSNLACESRVSAKLVFEEDIIKTIEVLLVNGYLTSENGMVITDVNEKENFLIGKNSFNAQMFEHMLWLIGNILGDCQEIRIEILEKKNLLAILILILQIYSSQFTREIWSPFNWCISNLGLAIKDV